MPDPRFNIEIRSGSPATTIPKETHLAVFRILDNLTCTGGAQLIKGSNDSWSIYVKPLEYAVRGTYKYGKVIVMQGYKKLDKDSDWQLMTDAELSSNPPAKVFTDFVEGNDQYPWYGMIPTLDYLRAVDLEET